jgi:hypothetical protein
MVRPSTSGEPSKENVVESVRQPAVNAMRGRHGLHVGALVVLIAWWGFGNLYESIVVMPWLWRLPPGSLPAEFAPGSPVFYFVPAGVALLALAWTLVIRVYRTPGGTGSRRAVLRTAVLVTIASAGTGILVTVVNPTFRDPMASVASVRSAVLVWEMGNAVRIALAVAAAISLLRWRGPAGETLLARTR